MKFKEINPSPRTLMTPGPVEADPRVLRAMGAHILGQFDPEFTALMNETMEMAEKAGIKKDTIMLDPGIGFAKDLDQNLELMNHLELLNQWDVPVLLGTSRKSMIGLILDLPSDQRVEGTVATTVSGYMKGCRFFRVHDVKENMRAMKMIEAICAK